MEKQITYRIATTAEEFENGKKLFHEYVISLNVDLSFQNFETELETIDTQYNKPAGALLLAMDGDAFVGCSGIRKLDDETAELKRMYVKNQYRGYQVGVALLQRSCEIAKQLGYKKLRLDTLASMTKAQQLYAASGFYEIEPYRFNPLPGTMYMEKEL
ncbi:GNAT family N-acetyltransferase [Mucilaginibacter flavidus]|uniref:GNAT family N-acetyltransferase n=1 Tax=Mucilaginibacter flavidus TaxID=2949309 RepID=UPI0020934EC5|nr:GNAT family N-acetyltransferase [Mucilaginibacter flavidus]MCO5949226.1 GNAT family N-acetyltransferase [Mucilaginibacter flavidus]